MIDIDKTDFLAATEGKAVGAITSRASRTIYVIAAIIAVLIIAFVSIVVYLKVQHARWGLPSKRSSTGSISKSTQSTLQHPSMEITKSMADIKSCILNEVYSNFLSNNRPFHVILALCCLMNCRCENCSKCMGKSSTFFAMLYIRFGRKCVFEVFMRTIYPQNKKNRLILYYTRTAEST